MQRYPQRRCWGSCNRSNSKRRWNSSCCCSSNRHSCNRHQYHLKVTFSIKKCLPQDTYLSQLIARDIHSLMPNNHFTSGRQIHCPKLLSLSWIKDTKSTLRWSIICTLWVNKLITDILQPLFINNSWIQSNQSSILWYQDNNNSIRSLQICTNNNPHPILISKGCSRKLALRDGLNNSQSQPEATDSTTCWLTLQTKISWRNNLNRIPSSNEEIEM